MKKLKFVCFGLITMFSVLLTIVFGGVDASAYTYDPTFGINDFTPYKDDIVVCDLTLPQNEYLYPGLGFVYLYIDEIDETPVNKGFGFRQSEDFHPGITSVISDPQDWSYDGFDELFGVDELYWNPLGQYWQIGYPDESDFYEEQYYILKAEINDLKDQIQELVDALDLEYDRGYDEGLDDGYDEGLMAGEPEAYERGFKNGQESKLAKNNEAFYQGIEKWLVPAIITVIALGGFVSIAVRKRRDE